MLPQFLVRVGLIGQVGRFISAGDTAYRRGQRVVCRTGRGLEIGELLAPVTDPSTFDSDGALLRPLSLDDELLLARLTRKKEQAYEACVALLANRGLTAVLMDVEHLFDGRSLYFYFLGDVTPELEQLTADLAATYDATVEFKKFAETLAQGCGPECGKEDHSSDRGHGGGCSSCAVSHACGNS